MILLILRHTLPVFLTRTNEISLPILVVRQFIFIWPLVLRGYYEIHEYKWLYPFSLQLLFLRIAGIVLPIYIILRAVTALQNRRHRQVNSVFPTKVWDLRCLAHDVVVNGNCTLLNYVICLAFRSLQTCLLPHLTRKLSFQASRLSWIQAMFLSLFLIKTLASASEQHLTIVKLVFVFEGIWRWVHFQMSVDRQEVKLPRWFSHQPKFNILVSKRMLYLL